ncbi:MAG: zinc-ribbon domain-containing protein [Desulfovibrio sp.]|nr:zinc-ribbon domain-containing protein [Desulfovibrio sp.]
MKITCPQCGFSREMPPERLPARAVIATCPQCAFRFRFAPEMEAQSPGNEASLPLADNPPAAAASKPKEAAQGTSSADSYEDDPLPPGAVIPGRTSLAGESARQGEDSSDVPGNGEQDEGQEPLTQQAVQPSSVGGNDADGSASIAPGQHMFAQKGRTNPWEAAPGDKGWIAAFYHTCLRVMFGAQQFFSGLRADAPQLRALLFYLVITVIQVLVEWIWTGILLSLVAPSTASDPELAKMLAMLSPQTPLVALLKTGLSVAQLYILATLLHFFYGFVVKTRPEFSLVFQVVAYSAAPSLLCIVPLVGSIAGFIWMLACLLVGLRASMRLSWAQTFAGFVPVLLLLVPLLLQVVKVTQG